MKLRTPLHLALLSSLCLAGCAADLQLPQDQSKSDDQTASKYVGLWTGMDDTQSSCEVEVLAYEERLDEKIPGVAAELATQDLSKMRRSMRLRVSLQADQETIFAALSTFDSQSTAYANRELSASNPIDDLVTESIVVTLDPSSETLTALRYSKDAQNHCNDLQRVDGSEPASEIDPETEIDPEPEPEFVPHPRGSSRR